MTDLCHISGCKHDVPAENGEKLARVATSGLHLTDDLKARVLSTFLTLMNLRENLDRAAMRTPSGRSGIHR